LTRLLVSGPRSWEWEALALERLEAAGRHWGPEVTLIHGAARGLDTLAATFGYRAGWEVVPFPVTADEWQRLRKRAGHLRNQRMITEGHPDVCLGFVAPCIDRTCERPKPHQTHGTANCMTLALRARVPVYAVYAPTWRTPATQGPIVAVPPLRVVRER
jgi:hypothetical protein